MATNITAKAAEPLDRAALEAALAEAHATIAERNEQLAHLAAVIAGPEPAQAAEPAAKAAIAKGQPEPSADTPWAREDQSLAAMAIIAQEGRHPADRQFWRRELDRLGAHLGPDRTASERLELALGDERGRAFLLRIQAAER